jgi:hypothetical protein
MPNFGLLLLDPLHALEAAPDWRLSASLSESASSALLTVSVTFHPASMKPWREPIGLYQFMSITILSLGH